MNLKKQSSLFQIKVSIPQKILWWMEEKQTEDKEVAKTLNQYFSTAVRSPLVEMLFVFFYCLWACLFHPKC